MFNYYVYRHIRLDTNEVFYIGIGSDTYKKPFQRAYSAQMRSLFWMAIVAKTEYLVEIVMMDLSKSEAYQKETELIKLYGRRDQDLGTLVNMTDGGDGLNGHAFSDEHRAKISLGNKGKIFSAASRAKMSKAARAKKMTPEHKANISHGLLGNKYCLGYKHTDETRRKVSVAGIGRKPMLGKHHTEETKKHLSEVLKGKTKPRIKHDVQILG